MACGVELHKLQILHGKSGARSHGAAVASGRGGEVVLVVAGIPLGIFHRSNMEIVPNEMGISMGKSKGIPPMK
jgi:hypothetical protein